MIKFGSPNIGDEEHEIVGQVLDSGIFVHGKYTQKFEEGFAGQFGYDNAISVANCTAGLHLSHFSLVKHLSAEQRETKEVICPAMTHVATAHAIELAGMRPVFIDCNAEDGNIDVSKVQQAINKNTIGIAAMHFNGCACDIIELQNIASNHELYMVEDCAISLGAKVGNKPIGSFGDAGVFSFHPVKQMTTGEGGMIVCNDKAFANQLSLERSFGVDRNFSKREKAGIYDVPHLGFNYRMAEIPAAIGVAQLKKYEQLEAKRKKNFKELASVIRGIQQMKLVGGELSEGRSFYCLIATIDGGSEERDKLAAYLKENNVQTSVYYPHPIPRLEYYRQKYDFIEGYFENAERISDNSIAFSIGAHLDENQLDVISGHLKDYFKYV